MTAAPRRPKSYRTSLAALRPDIAAQWDYEANAPLTPDDVTAASNFTFNWVHPVADGGCGHRWQSTVHNRRRQTIAKCPRQKHGPDEPCVQDIVAANAVAYLLWHPEKNEGKNPAAYLEHSNEHVWFLGPCGHSWKAVVSEITRGQRCAVCHGKQIEVGVNDLATTEPELCSEWDCEKNPLSPKDVTRGSQKKVHWTCLDFGHRWEASIASRTRGNGCPYCSGKRVLAGFNDLATTRPDVAEAWDYARNPGGPEDVTPGSSSRKYCWICPECTEPWTATVANRCQTPMCWACGHRQTGWKLGRPAPGQDLATLRPDLAAEWDPEKNQHPASHYRPGSAYKAAWICSVPGCGYQWNTKINSRTNQNRVAEGLYGCLACRNRRTSERISTPLPGRSFADEAPRRILDEWDPCNPSPPTAYKLKSGSTVWWVCSDPECGTRYQTPIYWRTACGVGCPACSVPCSSQVERDISEALSQRLVEHLEPLTLTNSYFVQRNGKTTRRKPQWDMGSKSMGILLDYDGFHYHSEQGRNGRDYRKTRAALDDGWAVVRIRETPLDPLDINHPRYAEVPFCFQGPAPLGQDLKRLVAVAEVAVHQVLSAPTSSGDIFADGPVQLAKS